MNETLFSRAGSYRVSMYSDAPSSLNFIMIVRWCKDFIVSATNTFFLFLLLTLQMITTLNGSKPMTNTYQTVSTISNFIGNSTPSHTSTTSEDEISKKLPKEILLRIMSYLDVVSLCRCAQVSEKKAGYRIALY